jgi:transposase InsO family protein
MGLAKSTYYYRLKNEPKAKLREEMDAKVKDLIDNVHIDFPIYGYRKLHRELKRRGIVINEKKIRRIQRKFGLFATQIRKWIKTTDSKHKLKKYPKLLTGALRITNVNEVWVSDITYVRILTGFIFVAIILDLFSRKVVGWAISKRINAELAVNALNMAIKNRKPSPGCIHHSDQGVQYCSKEYIEILDEWKFQISMSRKGNPYDNAWAESFMKILKYEEIYLSEYETYEDVVNRLPHFIEEIYNRKRIHSSIGYLTPEEFEVRFMKQKPEVSPLHKT